MNLAPLYDAFKIISKSIRDSDVVNLGSDMTTKNTSNDVQKNIDILSNNAIKNAARKIPEIIGIVSEEDNDVICFNPNSERGYVLTFDP